MDQVWQGGGVGRYKEGQDMVEREKRRSLKEQMDKERKRRQV